MPVESGCCGPLPIEHACNTADVGTNSPAEKCSWRAREADPFTDTRLTKTVHGP